MKVFRKELQSFIDRLDVPKPDDKQEEEPLSVSAGYTFHFRDSAALFHINNAGRCSLPFLSTHPDVSAHYFADPHPCSVFLTLLCHHFQIGVPFHPVLCSVRQTLSHFFLIIIIFFYLFFVNLTFFFNIT